MKNRTVKEERKVMDYLRFQIFHGFMACKINKIRSNKMR